MNTHANIRDEDLHAFIDGELTEADRARVQAALDADAELGAQLAAFRADKARLVSLYGGGLHEPLPREWIAQIEEASRRKPALPRAAWAMLALAASFVLVLSGTIVWRQVAVTPRNDVVADALAARALERKPDYVVPVSSEGDAQAESAVMAKSLATRVKAPDLSRMGYRLVGIDVYSTPAPSFDLRYVDTRGRAVTLYIRRSPGSTRFDILEMKGLKVCIWQDNIISTVVTGNMSAGEMQRLASLAYSGLTM
jgi:anti-sigma factor RsiW